MSISKATLSFKVIINFQINWYYSFLSYITH